MGRPLKQVVDYFPHMVNHGKTILILQNEFGNDGYAFWFSLLELLCKADGQYYDYNNPAAWRLLLAETHVKEDIANNILQILADVDAIDKELYSNKIIWIQNLVDNLDQVYDRRTTGKPTKPTYCKQEVNNNHVNVDKNLINNSINPTSKLNNTKLNNTKQDSTPKKPYGEFQNVLLTDDELSKLRGKFNSHYLDKIENLSVALESKGYKFKSHYATILSWARKDEKEKPQKGNVVNPVEGIIINE